MPASESQVLVRRLIQAVNKGDLSAIGELVPSESRGAVERFNGMARQALPDLQLTIDDTIAARDKVVIRWTARATHKGAAEHPRLGKVKATGKPLSVTGITILQIANGKIVETWGETSELDALEQLGAVPKLN